MTEAQTRTHSPGSVPVDCQNCKQNFRIDPEDFAYYERMKVPPPVWCSDCRTKRRYVWRNEHTLYKRKCDAPGHEEEIICMYAQDKPYKVYDDRYWWSDAWSAGDYGADYDFSRPFFEQYAELLKRVPLIGLSVTNNKDCSYCNVSAEDKECYMLSASGLNENSMYGNRIGWSKDCADVYISQKNTTCYEIVDSIESYRLFFSEKCANCIQSAFLYDCVNCQDCFLCAGLRNKRYHFMNQPLSKEEYAEKLKEFDLGKYSNVAECKRKLAELVKTKPQRFAQIINCVNTTGDNVMNSKNAKECFDGGDLEDCKFGTWTFKAKDCYDIGPGGWDVQLLYDTWDADFGSARIYFSGVIYNCLDLSYCWNCHASQNLFGCYGLRNKQYCILNKQYTKEEYLELVPKIIKHMDEMPYADSKGLKHGYGGFFPPEISPFAYNETIAHEYWPMSKEEVSAQSFYWRDKDRASHVSTMASSELQDDLENAPEDITQKVISCGHAEKGEHPANCEAACASAFRITPQELQFHKRLKLALPRECYNCRHYMCLAHRNPLRLWERNCMCAGKSPEGSYANTANHFHGEGHCSNKFQTAYAPDRKEMVYCDKCYQAEIV